MTERTQQKHFYMFDYFLNGSFLKREEVNCQPLVKGQHWIVRLDDGTELPTQVVEVEEISEDEHRVFLST